ncbi:MAG: hypothetical protein AABW89_06125 [Nanoarchaeota archaeon]
MALNDFVSGMETLEKIGVAESTLANEHDIPKRNKALDYLQCQGLKIYEDMPGVDLSQCSAEERREYAHRGLPVRKRRLTDSIGSALSAENLEGILEEINPNSFESLADERIKELGKAGVKGYDELLQMYREHLALKELGRKYAEGNADPRELQVVYPGVVEEVIEGIKKRNSGQVSNDTLDAIGQLARIVVSQGDANKDFVTKRIKRLIAEREKSLREYESKEGKTLAGFAIDSIRALMQNSNPEDSALARALLYEAAKKKVKKKVA